MMTLLYHTRLFWSKKNVYFSFLSGVSFSDQDGLIVKLPSSFRTRLSAQTLERSDLFGFVLLWLTVHSIDLYLDWPAYLFWPSSFVTWFFILYLSIFLREWNSSKSSAWATNGLHFNIFSQSQCRIPYVCIAIICHAPLAQWDKIFHPDLSVAEVVTILVVI